MRDLVGVLVGVSGLAMVVIGAWQIHPGLGLLVLGLAVVGLGKAILEA